MAELRTNRGYPREGMYSSRNGENTVRFRGLVSHAFDKLTLVLECSARRRILLVTADANSDEDFQHQSSPRTALVREGNCRLAMCLGNVERSLANRSIDV